MAKIQMAQFPVFLSVVLLMRNQEPQIESIVDEVAATINRLVSDYELIVIDNASTDNSISVLRQLTSETGKPNLQVYALTKEVDADTAFWVGLENALGDFVAAIDPMLEDISVVEAMLEKAVTGVDIVLANNEQKPLQTISYRFAYMGFNLLYRYFGGANLASEAPQYRLVSKRVVNFILQHPQPAITYRHLPVTGGFPRANLRYSSPPRSTGSKRLGDSIDRGVRLLVSTTRAPMRLVTTLSLFGACANLVYSAYVVLIALFQPHVAPGWISTSLQQSGMFFLISLVLLVLAEYILHMASLSNEGPLYHVAQEFTSARMTRREKLNIEEVAIKGESRPDDRPSGIY
ncbi:glycosyltransferase [Caballeronia sp. LP006]|uniref:glycosyltransferase n=1 Tax=Caballeronia sp. LP006 TaxID=3038552 RepID=UPI00285B7B18|nr:glycosyltransferase [Caballeronia sp. LP006]MDR5831960.1 glycosyltransferase [Caballeronia sp. LP006]